MKEIEIEIHKSEENYSCGWGYEGLGVIICTNKTIEGLKHDFEESLQEHIKDCITDGDDIPSWLVSGNYKIEYLNVYDSLLNS